jgi:hypothetical protein
MYTDLRRLNARRALSADARCDKVKLTAQIATRLQSQRSEEARLQQELASADELVVSNDLHPTAIKRFKQNLEQISGGGTR